MNEEYKHPAKLIKATVYFIDLENAEIDTKEGLQNCLDYNLDGVAMNVIVRVANYKSVDILWHDDIDLNKRGATIEQHDKYFED